MMNRYWWLKKDSITEPSTMEGLATQQKPEPAVLSVSTAKNLKNYLRKKKRQRLKNNQFNSEHPNELKKSTNVLSKQQKHMASTSALSSIRDLPTGKRKCPKCPASFGKHRKLIIHFNSSHQLDKLWQCVHCNFYVLTPEELTEHNVSIHGQLNNSLGLKCDFCIKKFLLQASLVEHNKAVHNIPDRKCFVCGMDCATHKELVIHVGEHEKKSGKRLLFSCHICVKLRFFLSALSKAEHMKQVHPREFEELCNGLK